MIDYARLQTVTTDYGRLLPITADYGRLGRVILNISSDSYFCRRWYIFALYLPFIFEESAPFLPYNFELRPHIQ